RQSPRTRRSTRASCGTSHRRRMRPRPDSRPNETGDSGRGLGYLLVSRGTTGAESIGDAVGEVVIEQLDGHGLKRPGDRRHLVEDVDAVLVTLHHPLDAPDLSLDAPQPLLDRVLAVAIT